MGDINLKRKDSVLLYLNISGFDTLILCFVGVLHLLHIRRQHKIQIQHKTFIMFFLLTSRQKSYCLRFLVNRIIIELLLQYI